MKMSDAHGAVVHLMWPWHLVWGPPRRAVHSPTIADGTASPTGANFRSQACISCTSSPQASEFTPPHTPPPRQRCSVAVAAAALHIRPPQLPRVVTRAIGNRPGWRSLASARSSITRTSTRSSFARKLIVASSCFRLPSSRSPANRLAPTTRKNGIRRRRLPRETFPAPDIRSIPPHRCSPPSTFEIIFVVRDLSPLLPPPLTPPFTSSAHFQLI